MACFKNMIAVVLGFMLVALCGVSTASVYKVGDDAGWATGKSDYMKWASAKTFHVGDVIEFVYDKKSENVLQVTRDNFHTCNVANPIATYATGNDTIHIKKNGHFYYISGSHCQAGLRVDIRVAGEEPTKPSPISSPSPAVSPFPENYAPAPAPSSAPSFRSAFGASALFVALAIFFLA